MTVAADRDPRLTSAYLIPIEQVLDLDPELLPRPYRGLEVFVARPATGDVLVVEWWFVGPSIEHLFAAEPGESERVSASTDNPYFGGGARGRVALCERIIS